MAEGGFAATERVFTAHMRDPAQAPAPAGVEDRRLEIYRGLLYRNVEGFMANAFPVLRSLYDEARWHALVRDYFAQHRARTPLFPKMPQEFLHYLEARGEVPGDPPFLRELAEYEWLEAEILFNPRELDEVAVDDEPDLEHGRPCANPVMQARCYRFPVHRIGPDCQPHTPPPAPTYLVVFRHRDDRVGFMELNAVSARLLQLVVENTARSGRALLEQVAAELAHPEPAAVVRHGLDILADFHARDIVLGTLAVGA
ncbi:MAG: putative DNA-binding domain-containing protein [Gammaproteobacteria bacterium]|nr:putative DNA-binding domain-containing protein [Gammaproteobacteria bacterium]